METFVASVHLVVAQHKQPDDVVRAMREIASEERGEIEAAFPLVGALENLIVICRFPNLQAATRAWYAIDAGYGWQTRLNPTLSLEQFQATLRKINGVPVAAR